MAQTLEDKKIQEDEIDLRELFKTIFAYKKFILIFTIVVTILAAVYAFTKTAVFEVTSTIRIGSINGELVENPKLLEEKLKVIYGLRTKKHKMTDDSSIVSSIKLVKKVNEFLVIKTQGFSNELALKKNKEVLNFIQNEYLYKINNYKESVKYNISKLKDNLSYMNNVEKNKIKKQILEVKTIEIPKIDKKIFFLKNVELKALNNELLFNQKKLKEYEKTLIKQSSKKLNDKAENVVVSMSLVNMRTLILDLQKRIENIKKQKSTLVDLTLKDLENKKAKLLSDRIEALTLKLKIDLVKKISEIKHKINLEQLKLTSKSIRNSHVVGEIIVNDSPIKPKKKLIIAVAFITSLILSIFIVFMFEFIKSFKEEEKVTNE